MFLSKKRPHVGKTAKKIILILIIIIIITQTSTSANNSQER